ncbi:MAG: DUF5615 family PIN-like protein [Pseudobdellovibrionaceae bacterium]
MKRKIKFIVDENLLGLLKKLRMMGVDSASLLGASDDEIYRKALLENRIILTKDRRFNKSLSADEAYFVKCELPQGQLLEVLRRFPECRDEEPLTRCFACNTLIERVSKESIENRLDKKTLYIYDIFFECPKCHKIYWEGSHFEKMQREVLAIKNQLGS